MTELTRRMIIGALPALGFAGSAFAQAPSLLQETPDDYLDAWVDIYGRPTAKVMLNGQGPFQFMVDTGSTNTVIAERHLATLGIAPQGSVTVAGTTGMSVVPTTKIETLNTGAVTKRGLNVAVLSDKAFVREDGILGADVFAGRRLAFDIRNKSVRVERGYGSVRTSGTGNMRVRNGLLAEIDGMVGAIKTKLMLDTGAQTCIANRALSNALLKRHPKLVRVDEVRVYGVTGHAIVGQFINLPPLDLKAFTVSDAGCVAADAPIFDLWELNDQPAMIVGVSVLSLVHSFSIDYAAKMFEARFYSELLARNAVALG